MKTLNTKLACKITLACAFFLLIAAFPGIAAEIDDGLAKCAGIKDDNTARLKCFDDLAKQQPAVKEAVNVIPAEKKDITVVPVEKAAIKEPVAEKKVISVMEKYWDMSLDPNNSHGLLPQRSMKIPPYPPLVKGGWGDFHIKEKNIFVLWPYRPNYFLPVAYNSSPNEDTDLDFDPKAKALYNEVKFQLSFKFKIWRDIVRSSTIKDIIEKSTGIRGIDIWVAYTQQSFWQLYNSAFSAPFRDTNYEPELLFNFRVQREIPGLMGTKLQFINVGFNHQSNGRSVPLSRSWNRIVANFGLEKDSFGLLLKTWYRIPEDETSDDNPDITRYTGYGELWGTLYWKKHRFAVMLRNNLRSENFGAVQLDWSIPLSMINKELGDKFSFYIQYFNGYEESLLDYNKSSNRISAGFMLADWN